MTHYKWTKIEQFHNIYKALAYYHDRNIQGHEDHIPAPATLTYAAKVKLHGSCGAIQFYPKGRIVAQSRNRILSITDDNYGFCAWANEFAKQILISDPAYIYVLDGEWCGLGIQGGVAASSLRNKEFCIFALRRFDASNPEKAEIMIDGISIYNFLHTPSAPYPIRVIPWYKNGITFKIELKDYDRDVLEIARINEEVDLVCEEDPYIKSEFGIKGYGEGLVLYPLAPDTSPYASSPWLDYSFVSRYIFKAKGEKHNTVKQLRPVTMTAEKAGSIQEFVDLVVTESRLQQGFHDELNNDASIGKLGAFLKWVSLDVRKECKEELLASGLQWNEVSSGIINKAKQWLLEMIR